MLNKTLKTTLKWIVIFSSLITILLVALIYSKINHELSVTSQVIASPENPIALHVQKASGLILMETILLSVIFLSLTISVNYLLSWYFIENKNALVDELTEIYNRKGINALFRKEISRAKRFNHPLSVAMVDIDNFKVYNDQNGHLGGDWLLKAIAKILKMNTREMDIVGRYGGEEFIAILPEVGHDHAFIALERIRNLIEKTVFPKMEMQPNKKVTVSIGLATFVKDFDETGMIHEADSLLYAAKQKGKNALMHKDFS